ncbi:MAG: hypothetical protein R6W48_11010 [Gaiellaceae bacterium]
MDAGRAARWRQLALQLNDAAAGGEPTERLLEVAAIVSEAVQDLGVEPIVVGGLALAHWTDSSFLTADIDVVIGRPAELSQRLEALGFRRLGREWVLGDHELSLEAPGERLEPGETAVRVTLPSGRTVLVLSAEDLLLWRVREWIHWRSISGFRQAAYLLYSDVVDITRLEVRSVEEGLTLALAALRRTAAEVEAGRAVEPWELEEIAKHVERESYRGGCGDG